MRWVVIVGLFVGFFFAIDDDCGRMEIPKICLVRFFCCVLVSSIPVLGGLGWQRLIYPPFL